MKLNRKVTKALFKAGGVENAWLWGVLQQILQDKTFAMTFLICHCEEKLLFRRSNPSIPRNTTNGYT